MVSLITINSNKENITITEPIKIIGLLRPYLEWNLSENDPERKLNAIPIIMPAKAIIPRYIVWSLDGTNNSITYGRNNDSKEVHK